MLAGWEAVELLPFIPEVWALPVPLLPAPDWEEPDPFPLEPEVDDPELPPEPDVDEPEPLPPEAEEDEPELFPVLSEPLPGLAGAAGPSGVGWGVSSGAGIHTVPESLAWCP